MNNQPETSRILSVTVETRILGWGAETRDVPLPSAQLHVADLIRAKITAEWEGRQRGERAVVGRESLAPEALNRPTTASALPDADSLDGSVRSALDGYRAGWYIILVDGEEPGGLDTRLTLGETSVVAFVRVYPLPDAPRRDGRA